MKATRLPVLAALAAIAGAVGYSAGLLVDGAGNTLPRVPVAAAGVLGLLAAVLLGLGFSTRSRLRALRERRSDARPLNALATARSVVLARASSLVGSAMAGAYGGYTLFLVLNLDEPGRSELAGPALAAALAAAAVVVGALFLEHVCRLPEGDGPGQPGLPGPRADHAG